MTISLINRDPESGELGNPRDGDIFLEIVDDALIGIDDSATQIYVEGVLAYDGGSFQAGFNGTGSASTLPFAYTRRINIDPTNDFDSEQEITVHVVSETTGGAHTIDESYTFTIEDFTPPQIVSVTPIGVRTLRVVFNEPMTAVSASNADDALNLLNYSFARLDPPDLPAVNVVASSVVANTDSEFEITTDIELSFGRSYTLTVANAEDASGNVIAAPFNVVTFNAFTPARPERRWLNVYELLPQINRSEDTTLDLFKFCACLQDVLDVLLYDIDRWTAILDLDTATEQFLDAMLFGLGNPFSFVLTENDKRRLLRVLVTIYRKKGLAEGIEETVLFFMGLTIEVLAAGAEGWELGVDELGYDAILGPGDQATLYSFDIDSAIVLTDEQREQITKIANYMKPAHTHLRNILEPSPPIVLDHWELGLSELGEESILH